MIPTEPGGASVHMFRLIQGWSGYPWSDPRDNLAKTLYDTGRTMFKKLTLALTLMISASPIFAQADGGEPIDGYQQYKFGVKINEIKGFENFVKKERVLSIGGIWYKHLEDFTINNSKYTLWVRTNDEYEIDRVELVSDRDFNPDMCISSFNSVFGAIKAKYGSPDLEPEKKKIDLF